MKSKEEIVEIIRRYAGKLREKGINFRKIILFGSYARDTAHKDSDIDVAVISEGFGEDRFEERVLLSKIGYDVDVRIEPHPVNLRDYMEDNWQPLLHEIKTQGLEIAA